MPFADGSLPMISNKALACVSNMITSPLALDLNLYNIGDVRGVERGSMLRLSHDSTTVHITCVLCLESKSRLFGGASVT